LVHHAKLGFPGCVRVGENKLLTQIYFTTTKKKINNK
jgi:hypothetical protein